MLINKKDGEGDVHCADNNDEEENNDNDDDDDDNDNDSNNSMNALPVLWLTLIGICFIFDIIFFTMTRSITFA